MRQRLGLWVLRTLGWELIGRAPSQPRYVAVGAPHTTNWDLLFAVSAAWALGMNIQFVGKRSLFIPPLGWLMRALGGRPIKRSKGAGGQVEAMAALFSAHERFVLAIAPEGTRRRTERWRSGFYRIATAAGVPIVLGVMDYGRKRVGIIDVITPTGNVAADMDRIRAAYARAFEGSTPPDRFGPVRLRDESAAQESFSSA